MSHYSIRKKVNGYVLIYMLGSIFPMLMLDSKFYFAYVKCFFVMLPLMWVYLSLRKSVSVSAYLSVFLKYSNIMIVLSVISLIMWILCSILQVIPMTSMFPYEWHPTQEFIPTYYGIYFETQTVGAIWRNTGIFNEGPMYNMVLCMALTIECFIRPIKSKVKICILIITIISTLTTTGQLFLLLLGGYFLYKRMSNKLRMFFLIIMPFCLYVFLLIVYTVMNNKIETGGEGSVNARNWDIQQCIEIGLEHPIMGIGMITEKKPHVLGREVGFSNSFFVVFMRGGIYVSVLYLGALLFIPFFYCQKYKDINWGGVMFCFFLIFCITMSFMKFFTFLFMAWGLSNIDMKRWNIYDCVSKY